jgi:23S rRNA pseudoU1915 N3-methylase RlmH
MNVRLISIGKSAPKWIEDAVEEYLTRTTICRDRGKRRSELDIFA